MAKSPSRIESPRANEIGNLLAKECEGKHEEGDGGNFAEDEKISEKDADCESVGEEKSVESLKKKKKNKNCPVG